MQLSEKGEAFSDFFMAILESILNFEHFEQNEPRSSSISEVIGSERRTYLNL